MQRLISAPAIRPPMQPYRSPVTGQWIDSNRARANDLARNNCIPYDPEMRKDADRKAKEADVQLDKTVDTIVEKTWHEIAH